MEASKEGEMPNEPAPETLPTEIKEEAPKKTKLLAVIIVVILVIAALGAAFGLGLFEKKKANQAPVAGAEATSPTSIEIGGYVTFKSTSTDADGTIAETNWYFGDGKNATGTTANHTFTEGGAYWVYLVVEDNKGATADNEATMIRVFVALWDPIAAHIALTNQTAPFAALISDQDVIQSNTTVTFSMLSCYAFGNWHWLNATDPSVGSTVEPGWQYIHSVKLDYGDGTAPVDVTPAKSITQTHKYTKPGHYAAKVTVTSNYSVSTSVINTIHVLKAVPPTPGIKNPDAFVYVTIGEPDYLDPAVDYETAGGQVITNVYETLIWYNGSSTTDMIPFLATEVPSLANGLISPDGLNYTFNLKSGVKFHNGETMTADDVVYSLQRMIRIHDVDGPAWIYEQVMTDDMSMFIDDSLQNFTDHAIGYTHPDWLLDCLGNKTDMSYVITEKDNQNASEAAVKKVDSDTVTLRLAHPYQGFLICMAFAGASVVSKKFVEEHGGVVNGEHNEYMDAHTCGTGPYQLVKWDVGSTVHLTRFANYRAALPALKDVYIQLSTDVNSRILMMQGGDADIIDLPIEYESLFAGDAKFRISKGNVTLGIDVAGFNLNINTTQAAAFGSTVPADFFADVHVRKAFAHLFDYTTYMANVRKGNALQPNGAIPKGMFGYNAALPVYDYSLLKAQWELENATAGLPSGHSYWTDGFTVALMYNAGNLYREAGCQYLKSAIETLGSKFHATVNTLDWPTYLRNLRMDPSPFPVFFLGWTVDYADPQDFVLPCLKTDGTFSQYTGYSNASIDLLISQAAWEDNVTLRQDLYNEMTNLTFEEAPYIWLAQPYNFHPERSWVHGFVYNAAHPGYYFPQFTKS